MDDKVVMVIANGSDMIKFGFAGADAPHVVFPAVLGTPKPNVVLPLERGAVCYYGDAALENSDFLELSYPIKGAEVDLEGLALLYEYGLSGDSPTYHCFLVGHPLCCSNEQLEKIAEVLFCRVWAGANPPFCAESVIFVPNSVLVLYASERPTGLVVDSGLLETHCSAVYEGNSLAHSHRRNSVAGEAVTLRLRHLLEQRDMEIGADPKLLRWLREAKEKTCYVALDPVSEESNCYAGSTRHIKSYEKPDGFFWPIGRERFLATEPLFDPTLLGKDEPPLHELILQSVCACDVELRAALLRNIVLAGGNTMLMGLRDRIFTELEGALAARQREALICFLVAFKRVTGSRMPRGLVPMVTLRTRLRVKIYDPPERKYSAWIGGSIVGSFSDIQHRWISREEYLECGPSIIRRKRFH